MLNKKVIKAFTLLELIVVIVVLGILAMLAVPTFNTVKNKSADSVAMKNAAAVARDYNAQVALAAADSSITPAASDSWVINGDTYSYTATSADRLTETEIPNAVTGTKGSARGFTHNA